MQEKRPPLTDRQSAIYTYIRQYIRMRGHSPSVREIADAVGLRSTASTHAQLETLEKKGYIRREATKARAIEIVDEKLIPSDTNTFTLHVHDDGMVKAGILNGDMVVVAEQHTANDGDTVVAVVDGIDMVRIYHEEDGDVILQPMNDEMEPVVDKEIQILGKVIAVSRIYDLRPLERDSKNYCYL